MHKIRNSGIHIFGVITLCQLYIKYIFSYSPSERAVAGDTCVPRNTQY